jgi:hypothetical protein
VFQAFLNHVFGDLIDRGVLGYVDDLLIHAATRELHDKILIDVFDRLERYSLKANPKKCEFLATQVKFLGHLITPEGLRMDPDKVKDILEWETPGNVKELQSFLGLANYYRRFIADFSNITLPLTRLTRKDEYWDFNSECISAFQTLKQRFKDEVILREPDPTQEFVIQCDASDYAIGAVLQQLDPSTDSLRPIGFYSRKLTKEEINYEIYEKALNIGDTIVLEHLSLFGFTPTIGILFTS